MNFPISRGSKASSPSLRSLTPTMLIESPKVTLANYRLMIKKSKERVKPVVGIGLSTGLSSPGFPSLSESIVSTDTCIFSSPANPETNDIQELRNQLEEMKHFTKNALESQRKYFEEIISGLENEIRADKESFNREINAIRDEVAYLKEEKDDTSTMFTENPTNWDYKTQYFKNQEFISLLEKQNKMLYEKIIGNLSESTEHVRNK